MLKYDRLLHISTAASRTSTNWNTEEITWGEFVGKLRRPVRGTELLAEYLKFPKSQQDTLKDVGGYVGGVLQGHRRTSQAVTGRDIISLDFDSIPTNGTEAIIQAVDGLGPAYAIYSTRKHSDYKPRLRILFPLDRTVTAEEYEPIARKMAAYIGIEKADPTTFQPCRLMYWPSCSKDGVYVFRTADKPFLSADGILKQYQDWHDMTTWPVVPGTAQIERRAVDKAVDPVMKKGTVGAFCRTYNIPAAIAKFIPNSYAPCGDGRYTYTSGSTTGGAVLYDDDKFIFSHHATDPISERLCNAFDLVRIHLFGDLDEKAEPDTPVSSLPSYKAMCAKAADDPAVSALMAQERRAIAVSEFTEVPANTAQQPAQATPVAPPAGNAWMGKLQKAPQTGAPLKTTANVILILENDPLLKGRIVYDQFSSRLLAVTPLPWDKTPARRDWQDLDDSGLRYYLERVYGITGKDRIFDALALCANDNKIDEVKDYLLAQKWDGVKRLDTLLIDYFGADNTPYTRAVTRKALVAAVARAMTPGAKYDTMLVLIGAQGIGKSTFLHRLGGEWFSDSLKTFDGKEAAELIQGVWIDEIGELGAFNKSEVASTRQFLSQTDDIFRPAYGRRTEHHARRCIFFGTSNSAEFLKDTEGNRRFWPVDLGKQQPTKDIFSGLTPAEVGQIWAEAVTVWRIGEPLYLETRLQAAATEQQADHREVNVKEGLILDFVAKPIPEGWDKWSLGQRRTFWAGGLTESADVKLVPRESICAVEVWCELFNGDMCKMRRADALELNGILENMQGWYNPRKPERFGIYGLQRGWHRPKALTV